MSQLYEIQPAPPPVVSADETARITTLPILLLNLHTQCNCKCVMCDIWQRKESSIFSAADLKRHRDSLVSLQVRQVVLTGGEPLLNPELGSICELLKSLGIKITLLTTGLLLRNRAALVAGGIDDIILSLDGPADVHNAIRRIPRAFEVVARGVESVRALRPSMPIACRTTVQKQNHIHLRATVDAAHKLGLQSISFLPADVTSKAFNRHEPWTEERSDEVSLTGREVDALAAEIEALIAAYRTDIRTGFIVENEVKLRRLAKRFRERQEGTAPAAPMCNAPWVSAVMDVDGGLRPCFFHPPTASTLMTNLEQAINSPSAMAFRSQLDVASNPTCQRCVCSLNYRQ